jgi:iron complex outermembrane receptor protein
MLKTRPGPLIRTTTLLAMAAHVAAAYAQESQAAQAAATQDGTGPNGMPEVIVTATKRSTSLLKTPVAITALSAKALDDAHVKNLNDVVQLTPSFQATNQGDHAVLLLTMRGIGNDGAKTQTADPEVSVYVDGVYSPRAEGATALLFDMEQVEVMRGPQGTLWGRNSTAGAVNMTTAKPSFGSASGGAELTIGNYARTGTRLNYNLPVNDALALRIAYASEEHDGYVDYQVPPAVAGLSKNVFVTSGPKYNAQDQKALRLSAALKPFAGLRWDVSYEGFSDNGTPNLNLNQQPRPGQDLWSALVQIPPYLHRHVDTIRSRVDWTLTPDMALSFLTGLQRTSGAEQFDARSGYTVPTGNTTGGIVRNTRINSERFSNESAELNLKSTGKRSIDWLLGAYWFHERTAIRLDQPQYSGTTLGPVAGTINSFVEPAQGSKSAALFTQETWNVSDRLRITGGARQTWDRKQNWGGVNYYCPGVQPNGQPCVDLAPSDNPAAVGFVPNPSVIGPDGKPARSNAASVSWRKPTWLLRADADLSRDLLGYASVATGYKSGVLTDGGVHTAPETLTSYELGLKGKALGGKLTWSAAAYYADFKGFQVSVPTTFPNGASFLLTANAEGAKSRGLEFEARFKPTPADTFQLAAAAQRTRLDTLLTSDADDSSNNNIKLPNGTMVRDLAGNELPHAPHFSATLAYERRFTLANGFKIMPRISSHYETASWLDIFNDGAPDRQDSWHRSDLAVRVEPESGKWSLEGFVQNVEDRDVKSIVGIVNVTPASAAAPVWQAQYLPPRTFGGRLNVYF